MIFTSPPTLGIHGNCYYHIIYSKFGLKLFYPAPYEGAIWHYKYVNKDLTEKAINNFNWKKTLEDCYSNKQIDILTDTSLIIGKVINSFNWKKTLEGCYSNKQINILTDTTLKL